MVAFSSFLSGAGCLELTNAILTALPTFAMCCFLLPKIVVKQIDKYRKHCLWRGSDINSKKPSKAAWPMVYLPKEQGGLSVLDITVQNECLLLKHLHKFYNRTPIPWVQLVWDKYYARQRLPVQGRTFRGSFWWRDILKLVPKFKDIVVVSLKDGNSCFLWHDPWGAVIFRDVFPELFSYAKNGTISVSVAVHSPLLHDLFYLPLSTKAYNQFLVFSNEIQGLKLSHSSDIWTYTWGSSSFFSNKAYAILIGHHQVHPVFNRLWRSACQNKKKNLLLVGLEGKIKYQSPSSSQKHVFARLYLCSLPPECG